MENCLRPWESPVGTWQYWCSPSISTAIRRGLLYGRYELIWFLCPLLFYWISHIWLIAHRGRMPDDPARLRDERSHQPHPGAAYVGCYGTGAMTETFAVSADIESCKASCVCLLLLASSPWRRSAQLRKPLADESGKGVRRGGSQDHSGTATVSTGQFHPHQVSRRKRGRRNSDQSESRDQRLVFAQGRLERRRPLISPFIWRIRNRTPEGSSWMKNIRRALWLPKGRIDIPATCLEATPWTKPKPRSSSISLVRGPGIPAKPRDRASDNSGGRNRVSPRARLGRREDHCSWSHPHGRHTP